MVSMNINRVKVRHINKAFIMFIFNLMVLLCVLILSNFDQSEHTN